MNAHERQQRAAETMADSRWNAVASRESVADGLFFYSVRSTGVYCRPSCAARLPRPENVSFHVTQADAEQAGFRPCKRCRPDQPRGEASMTGLRADRVVNYAIGDCSLGAVLVAKRTGGLCAILIGDEPTALELDVRNRFPAASFVRDDKGLQRELGRITAFIEAPTLEPDLPLDIRGTDFQQRVWHALREIPAGNTANYAEIAQRIGSPDATRAVARACAANLLAVAIPCHRVVRSDGALSDYRWGVERKRALLEREARA